MDLLNLLKATCYILIGSLLLADLFLVSFITRARREEKVRIRQEKKSKKSHVPDPVPDSGQE